MSKFARMRELADALLIELDTLQPVELSALKAEAGTSSPFELPATRTRVVQLKLIAGAIVQRERPFVQEEVDDAE